MTTDERGSATVSVAVALVAVVLLGIVVVDLAAVLQAAGRASAAADAAALAAATASAPSDPAPPARAARDVAEDNGATLERCRCGGPVMEATVSVPVHGIVLERVGLDRVSATARARLVVRRNLSMVHSLPAVVARRRAAGSRSGADDERVAHGRPGLRARARLT